MCSLADGASRAISAQIKMSNLLAPLALYRRVFRTLDLSLCFGSAFIRRLVWSCRSVGWSSAVPASIRAPLCGSSEKSVLQRPDFRCQLPLYLTGRPFFWLLGQSISRWNAE